MIALRLVSHAFLSWGSLLLITNISFAHQTASVEPVHDVEICAVLQNPRSFDGQITRFRGGLDFEFEANLVNDKFLRSPLVSHLHLVGLRQQSIADWEPNAKRIRALATPILKDAEFEEFNARAQDRRTLRPDGQPCNNSRECGYYDVIATFTGRFYAGRMSPSGKLGGFGHMGCCHLLVIGQVADVLAKPTPVPPENERFACTTVSWQSEFQRVSADSSSPLQVFAAHLAASKQFLINQARVHDGDAQAEAMESDSLERFGALGGATWSSRDLLTSYRIEFPQPDRSKAGKGRQAQREAADITVTVVKERCEPVSK